MNIEIVIIWDNNEPIAFWFNDKLIWESDKIIVDIDLLTTTINLPLVEAIKFSLIFTNGLTVDRLIILLAAVEAEVAKLEKLKQEEN